MKHKGLSLLEMLISLAILSVIMIITTPMVTVRIKHNIADADSNNVWNDTANPIRLNQSDANNYPNFIIGASGDLDNNGNPIEITTDLNGDGTLDDVANESGRLFIYNNGEANKNLPAINILTKLYFLNNLIDGSTINQLVITNDVSEKILLTLSERNINIRNQLVVDNNDNTANIVIANNEDPSSPSHAPLPNAPSLLPTDATTGSTATKGVTIIGHAVDNTTMPERDNVLYILAGLANNAPVVEADTNMIHIAGALTVSNGASDGNIIANQIYFASDKRLKNIKGEYKKGLNEILKIDPVEFTYKADKQKKVNVGVIAQDLKKIFPEAVTKRDDGYFMVKESPVFFALLNSVKELNSNYEKIKQNNDELEKQIAHLKADFRKGDSPKSDGSVK